ncbi:hypothetical protein EYR41_004206 [Orbilia oligospora]|uniref:Uncharacterized protein n=1 Tax=Orbilia oligospora TaxID=2813651 RepID=A0A8H2HV29_ORBOL|nr:hypothetical protein EYR41_004206 [Orbilia oligospora]
MGLIAAGYRFGAGTIYALRNKPNRFELETVRGWSHTRLARSFLPLDNSNGDVWQEAQSQDGDKYQVGLQHSDLAGIDINAITAASKDKTSDDVRVADSYIRVNWTVDDHRIERTPSQAVTDIGIKKCCLYPIPGSDVYSYRLEVYTETGFWGEEYHFCDETKDLYRLYANVNTDIYSTSSWKDYSSTLSGKQGSQKLGTAKINKLDVFVLFLSFH